MRALFLVSPGETPAHVLRAWLQSGREIAAVWTSKDRHKRLWKLDRRLGRLRPQWSVSATVSAHRLPFRQVPDLRNWQAAAELITDTGAEALISVYTSLIVPQAILDLFSARAVNFHPALLPAYRGPAPTDGMILDDAADRAGGMTLHVMTEGIDEGPIISQSPVPFSESGDWLTWRFDLARAAAGMTATVLPDHLDGKLATRIQPVAGASYRRIDETEFELNGTKSARQVENLCRIFGGYRPLFVREGLRLIEVERFLRRVGPPTGKAAETKALRVEFDAADARIVVSRTLPWTLFARQLRLLRRYLSVTSPRSRFGDS